MLKACAILEKQRVQTYGMKFMMAFIDELKSKCVANRYIYMCYIYYKTYAY